MTAVQQTVATWEGHGEATTAQDQDIRVGDVPSFESIVAVSLYTSLGVDTSELSSKLSYSTFCRIVLCNIQVRIFWATARRHVFAITQDIQAHFACRLTLTFRSVHDPLTYGSQP